MESLVTATTKYGERMLVKIIVAFRNTFSLICDGPHPDKHCLVYLGNLVRSDPQSQIAQQKESNNSRHIQSIL